MDILELFPFMRRSIEPQTPADTLPAITKRLNGGSGDPAQVSQAIKDLVEARSGWFAYKQDQTLHLQKLVAEGADEKKRRAVRDALARADEEINLLEDGEAPLRQRLVKAKADAVLRRRYRDQDALAVASKEIFSALLPLAAQASDLVKRAERGDLDIPPSLGMLVLPLLKFWADWITEKRPAIEAALTTLDRQPVNRPEHPESFPAGRPKFTPPKPQPSLSQIVAERPKNVISDRGITVRPRQPDDLSPLEPGEARVRVLREGYETPNGNQCDRDQIVKMPLNVAQLAMANKALVIIEMHVDSTDVKGGAFEILDAGVPITSLGSGGTALEQLTGEREK